MSKSWNELLRNDGMVLIFLCQFWRYCLCASVCQIWSLQLYLFGDMFEGMSNFTRAAQTQGSRAKPCKVRYVNINT